MRGISTLNTACSPVTIIKEGVTTTEPYEDLEKMTYEEYLQSRWWLKIRERTIKRDKKKCTKCKARKYLQVHHKFYRGRGKEKMKDLITFCRKCHENEHGIIRPLGKTNPVRPKKKMEGKKKRVRKENGKQATFLSLS